MVGSNKKTKKNGSKRSRKKKRPLKRLKLGFEGEFLILDEKGKPANKADLLLKKVNPKKSKTGNEIRKECGKSEIEIGSYPSHEVTDTAKTFLDNLKNLLYVAEKENLTLCPLGTYPGKFVPKMRKKEYKVAAGLFGRKFIRSGRVFGYHCHYVLPRGTFNSKKLTLKRMIGSKVQKTLVDSYNFLIAADPALTTFMQSSPFYQGYHFAKDARAIIYRRDECLKPSGGVPFRFQFDSPMSKILPSYQRTVTDILHFIENLYEDRTSSCKEAGFKPNYKSKLITNWTPVKVNTHGTLEQRGMDMNHPMNIMSVSFLVKSILKTIQQGFYKVKVSEVAIKRPFYLKRKTIHIPPFSYVKKTLQRASVLKGFDEKIILNYSQKLFDLAESFTLKKKRKLLGPLEKMLKDKKTLSDEIICEAKKLGHKNLKERLSQNIASKIAFNHSKKLFKEIVLVQKLVEEVSLLNGS